MAVTSSKENTLPKRKITDDNVGAQRNLLYANFTENCIASIFCNFYCTAGLVNLYETNAH